jgi:acetyl-CoA C-acetyltransferase
MKEVVITGAARTAAGSFLGALADIPAPKLGAIAIAEAVSRSGIPKEEVEQVIMGNVLPAGVGQAPARQAGIFAGIPVSAGAMTINKMCGSGLKAVMLAAQAVATDEFEVVVAGGMESMSRAPYLLTRGRTGYRLGNDTIYDHMMIDGLIDAYKGIHMGNCAELLSREHRISREDQDEYAATSYRRALAAIQGGKFGKEIVGVEIPQRKREPMVFRVDEEPSRGNVDKFPSLKPVFEKDGTVTAGNASTINDGGAAVVVMLAEAAGKKGIKPLGSDRALRDQRGFLFGRDRGDTGPRARPGTGQCPRRGRRPRTPGRRVGGEDPDHPPVRHGGPGREVRHCVALHRRRGSRRSAGRAVVNGQAWAWTLLISGDTPVSFDEKPRSVPGEETS